LVDMIQNSNTYELNTPIMFIDADFKRRPSFNPLIEILNDFGNDENVDVLLANGRTGTGKGKYYDIFALRAHQFSLIGPELIGEKFWNDYVYDAENSFYPEDIAELVPVFSGFAGIGIYKAQCLVDLKYSELPNEALKEMYEFIITTYPEHKSVIYYKTLNIGKENKIQFIPNSGHFDPVCCEHIPAHANLWKKGFKVFIHSKLEYLW